MRPCYLAQILIDEQADQQVIFLAEREGRRRLPITIGPLEAVTIDRAVKGQKFPRPLTHDLLLTFMNEAGFRCTGISIVDLREGTFFAQLHLVGPAERELVLDCRPSDAIALMVRLPETPLLVAEAVLAEAGIV